MSLSSLITGIADAPVINIYTNGGGGSGGSAADLTPYARLDGSSFSGNVSLNGSTNTINNPTLAGITKMGSIADVEQTINKKITVAEVSTALQSYSTTSQMNTAISTALQPYSTSICG